MSASATAPHPSLPISKTVSERLRKKASRHVKERIIEALLFAAAAFSVPYARVPLADGGYTMDHGAGIFVVDPAGALAALSSSARDAAALARDYRKLIAWREDDR